MNTEENLHKGHRKRMMERFLASPDNVPDHELLEVLLFGVLPRVDTNPIAHRLINAFGNLDFVFRADAKTLTSVEGVGPHVASHLVAMGKIMDRIIKQRQGKEKYNFGSFEKVKSKVIKDFAGLKQESFKIYLLDGAVNLLTTLDYTNERAFSVEIDPSVLANHIAIHKPKQILIAHNHPSGDVFPSKEDDLASQKAHILCALHGVQLIDHVIVSGEKTYSYYRDNRLQEIKQKANLDKIFRQGEPNE